MELTLAYDAPTAVTMRGAATTVQLATDTQRPAAFRGRVRDPLRLRQMLSALQGWLDVDARSDQEFSGGLRDPVVTVHPDQIFIEAFGSDGSAYLRLSLPISAFEQEHMLLRPGTTTARFSSRLHDALRDLRSSRPTEVVIGSAGLAISSGDALPDERLARRFTVAENWLKGFLQVQSALTQRHYSFDVRPTDMLSVIAYLDEHIPRRAPHGLRYLLQPGEPIAVVLEPWEERFTLRDTHYSGYERTVRVWGRRRLGLLRDALPFADRLTVSLLGRGLPHIYTCAGGPFHLLLAIPGWGVADWASGGAFDLLAARAPASPEHVEQVDGVLRAHLKASQDTIAAETGLGAAEVEQALFTLCRAGRVMVDFESGSYRLRDLFGTPIDAAALFPPDPRVATAERLAEDATIIGLRSVRAPGGRREMRVKARVSDGGERYIAAITIDDGGRMRFGHCECPFFQAYLMSRGPCEHLLATRLLFDSATAAERPV
jgi:hypothetical protein